MKRDIQLEYIFSGVYSTWDALQKLEYLAIGTCQILYITIIAMTELVFSIFIRAIGITSVFPTGISAGFIACYSRAIITLMLAARLWLGADGTISIYKDR